MESQLERELRMALIAVHQKKQHVKDYAEAEKIDPYTIEDGHDNLVLVNLILTEAEIEVRRAQLRRIWINGHP